VSGVVTEVKLLMGHHDGRPLYDLVPAVPLGERRYRIVSSPGFAPGVAAGDEIELTISELTGYRVLRRGGNVCVQLFLSPHEPLDRRAIAARVEAIGGRLDGGKDGETGHLLIFTIPVTAGFGAIERAMEDISASHPVDRWMYGNVYDTRDGKTPLNWWQ
jgi:hypothetical protein